MPSNRRWFWGASAFICLLSWVFLSFSPAFAADFNLTTSPLPVDLATTPGHAVSTTLRVQNSGTAPADIKVSLKKFRANGTNGTPQLLNRGPGDNFFDWVSFSKDSFVAQPGQWNSITMTISPPAGAAFGYYFAVLFSNANSGGSGNTTAAQLQGAVATLVLLDVKAPGEKRILSVTSFSSAHGLYEYLPANFSVAVKNTGNVHVIPSGSIYIEKGGKTIATLDVNPGGGNVLPGTTRIFNVAWKDGFPVFEPKLAGGQTVTNKKGQLVMSLNWNFSHANKLRLGHYNAHLVLTYDNGSSDVPVEGNVGFWVVPWKILPLIILVLALIAIGLWTSGKNFWRRLGKHSRGAGQK